MSLAPLNPKPSALRVRRYLTPKKNGELQCSPEVLKMAKDSDGSCSTATGVFAVCMYKSSCVCSSSEEKLRKLLLQHGGHWDKVEVSVKQWSQNLNSTTQRGGYVTKQWLMDNESYTEHPVYICDEIVSYQHMMAPKTIVC